MKTKKISHPWLLSGWREPKPRGSELAYNRGATSRQDELLDGIAFQKTPLPWGKQMMAYSSCLNHAPISHKSQHQRLRNRVVLRQVQSESKQELFKLAHVSTLQIPVAKPGTNK